MGTACVPPPRSTRFLARFCRTLWTLPTNLLGLAVGFLVARARPERIGGPAASAWLFRLKSTPPARALAAIAIGNVILAEEGFIAGSRGRWVLAHELSHTRQHAWLGPLYLPVHALLQLLSALCSLVRPIPRYPAQHAYNPLERWILYVPFDELVAPAALEQAARERILDAFGV